MFILIFILIIILIIILAMLMWCLVKIYMFHKVVVKYEQRLSEMKEKHQREIKDATKRSNDVQRNVIKGQIAEQLTPFIHDFPFQASACQFLGKPIDYIIFHQLDECERGECLLSDVKIIFADVKTGSARLNKRQKIIQDVISNKQVEFCELRIKEQQASSVIV